VWIVLLVDQHAHQQPLSITLYISTQNEVSQSCSLVFVGTTFLVVCGIHHPGARAIMSFAFHFGITTTASLQSAARQYYYYYYNDNND
jgi:hypothetical protein